MNLGTYVIWAELAEWGKNYDKWLKIVSAKRTRSCEELRGVAMSRYDAAYKEGYTSSRNREVIHSDD